MKKDELVFVGYTSQRKVDLTGSVAVVSTDDLRQATILTRCVRFRVRSQE